MNSIRVLIFLCAIASVFQVNGQSDSIRIPVRAQTGDSLNTSQFYCNYSFRTGADSLIKKKMARSSIVLPISDDITEVEIRGSLLQDYYNEFGRSDLIGLTCIEVYFSWKISHKSPRFFINAIENSDIQVSDSLNWFAEWLDYRLGDSIIEGYSVNVYSTKKLKYKQRRLIKKLHRKILEYLGGEPKLVITDEPYTTTDDDAFNLGTKITQEFIDSQNTDNMKGLAEQYSIVMMIEINWNRD